MFKTAQGCSNLIMTWPTGHTWTLSQCVCCHIFKLIYIEGKGWKVVRILGDWTCGSDYLNTWRNFGSNVKSIMSFTRSKSVQG